MAQQAVNEAVVASGSVVSSLSDPYVSIEGAYGESIITNKDGQLTVTMGKRPTASGYYCAPVLIGSGSVNFPDDKEFTYTFDGEKINWSNNTQWSKNKIDGNWIDGEKNEITITLSSDGELEIKWITNNRPVSYGNFNIISNKGYVRFVDDKKFQFVFNGNDINWSNKTVWKRK